MADEAVVLGGCTLQLKTQMQPEWKDYADRAREGWSQIVARLEAALAAEAA